MDRYVQTSAAAVSIVLESNKQLKIHTATTKLHNTALHIEGRFVPLFWNDSEKYLQSV